MEAKEQRLRFADTNSLGSYANKEVISIWYHIILVDFFFFAREIASLFLMNYICICRTFSSCAKGEVETIIEI